MRKMLVELKNKDSSEASICWWYIQEIILRKNAFKLLTTTAKIKPHHFMRLLVFFIQYCPTTTSNCYDACIWQDNYKKLRWLIKSFAHFCVQSNVVHVDFFKYKISFWLLRILISIFVFLLKRKGGRVQLGVVRYKLPYINWKYRDLSFLVPCECLFSYYISTHHPETN